MASQQDGARDFVLDALEQALHDRRPASRGGLVHHSDRGAQYVSISTPSASPKPGSSLQSAVSATVTTVRVSVLPGEPDPPYD